MLLLAVLVCMPLLIQPIQGYPEWTWRMSASGGGDSVASNVTTNTEIHSIGQARRADSVQVGATEENSDDVLAKENNVSSTEDGAFPMAEMRLHEEAKHRLVTQPYKSLAPGRVADFNGTVMDTLTRKVGTVLAITSNVQGDSDLRSDQTGNLKPIIETFSRAVFRTEVTLEVNPNVTKARSCCGKRSIGKTYRVLKVYYSNIFETNMT